MRHRYFYAAILARCYRLDAIDFSKYGSCRKYHTSLQKSYDIFLPCAHARVIKTAFQRHLRRAMGFEGISSITFIIIILATAFTDAQVLATKYHHTQRKLA